MTGADHYRLAEQLLEHAAAMLDTNVAPQDRVELVVCQAAIAAMARAARGRGGDRTEPAPGCGRYERLARCREYPVELRQLTRRRPA